MVDELDDMTVDSKDVSMGDATVETMESKMVVVTALKEVGWRVDYLALRSASMRV